MFLELYLKKIITDDKNIFIGTKHPLVLKRQIKAGRI